MFPENYTEWSFLIIDEFWIKISIIICAINLTDYYKFLVIKYNLYCIQINELLLKYVLRYNP